MPQSKKSEEYRLSPCGCVVYVAPRGIGFRDSRRVRACRQHEGRHVGMGVRTNNMSGFLRMLDRWRDVQENPWDYLSDNEKD